jgi:hypothetical protein
LLGKLYEQTDTGVALSHYQTAYSKARTEADRSAMLRLIERLS